MALKFPEDFLPAQIDEEVDLLCATPGAPRKIALQDLRQPLLSRLTALETAPVVDVSDILARLTALETATPESGLPAGVVMVWPVAAAIPSDFLALDGTEYAVSVAPALAAIFGESAPGLFRVPDWRDRAVVGASAAHPVASTFGEEAHTLTIPEMPAHDGHGACGATTVTGNIWVLVGAYGRGNVKGGGLPHNNLPPSVAAIWIIKK